MTREFSPDNNPIIPPTDNPVETGRLLKNSDYRTPEIAKLLEGLTEKNAHDLASQIIEDTEAKIILKKEIMERIFNEEPVTGGDIRACQNNNPNWTTISGITGNSLGVFRPQDIVNKEGLICLQSRNMTEGAMHYDSIPKNILVDVLGTAFLDTAPQINLKVPVSDKQREILDRALANMELK